jgi:CBS domain containing-hemolysin-like protein
MTPRVRVETLDADVTVDDLVARSRHSGFSRFPVQDRDPDAVLGVVHVKQAFGVPGPERERTPLRGLVQPVPTVPESLDGDALLTELRGSGLQMAVVVDEYGGTAGIVTLEDLIEELVGEIHDEYDAVPDPAPADPTAPAQADGRLNLADFAEQVGVALPSGPYETVGGFVMAELGRLPEAGDHVEAGPWRLTVTAMDGRRVARVTIARTPPAGLASQAVPAARAAVDPVTDELVPVVSGS